jgi:sulfur carrier protein ThiS
MVGCSFVPRAPKERPVAFAKPGQPFCELLMLKVNFRNSEWEVPGNVSVRQLITRLGLDPQSILAVKEGKLLHSEARLGDEGEIKLISVISGG